jgi:hypothetical protein
MDQRSIVLYLHLKGLLAHVIHDDLVSTLDSKAVGYSSVTRYLREAKLVTAEVTLDREASSPRLDDSNRAISGALEEKKSHFCVRKFTRATHTPRTTVYRRLTKLLGFVRYLFRWMPHLLSDAQKVRRVELFLPLLRMLEVQKQRAWHDVVTLDKS